MRPVGRRLRAAAFFHQLGPGLVTGAADDDPSGIATYSQAGARFGYGLLWTMVLTYPLMSAVQLIAAEIGRVTGCGLAKAMRDVLPRPMVTGLVGMLFVANTINVGADLAAMGEAGRLVTGWDARVLTIGFAFVSLGLQLFVPYHRYVRYLKWLTLALFAYVAVLFAVKLDWGLAAHGLVSPRIEDGAMTMVVAILGTTISPYLFFWQSSQEVEEVDGNPDAGPLKDATEREGRREIRRIKLDTFVGMAVSNAVAIAIMLSTAATLHASGHRNIATAADAAEALRPVAGPFAFALFALGIIATGLLAVPVLAGSAAYAVGESRGWKVGLEKMPWEAAGFYSIVTLSTLLGVGILFSPLDPIQALIWSAVINGAIAAPIMAAMMVVVARRDEMGRFTAGPWLLALGWIATVVMGAATGAMLAQLLGALPASF
jgi:NRAMP (natural resistance-associated macrophage protein)-like metal ion transporter